LDKIWIAKNQLSWLSNRYFSAWYAIQEKGADLGIFKRNKKGAEEAIKLPEYLALSDLKTLLEAIETETLFKSHWEEKRAGETNNWQFFTSLIKQDGEAQYAAYLTEKYKVQSFLPNLDKTDKEQKDSIKNLGDQAIFLFRFLKVFKVKADS
jgi:hypothetical protein